MALFPDGAPRWVDALLQMMGAVVLVIPLAFTYVRTRTRVKFDHSLVQTVIVLPIVVTAILVVVRTAWRWRSASPASWPRCASGTTSRNRETRSTSSAPSASGSPPGSTRLSVAAVLSIVFVVVRAGPVEVQLQRGFERRSPGSACPSGADLAGVPEPNAPPHPEPTPPAGAATARRTRLRIYVDRVEAARPLIETVLARDAKHWSFEAEEQTPDHGAPVLAYRVRPAEERGARGLAGQPAARGRAPRGGGRRRRPQL